ncbi:MAG TPA: sugar phosphate isomerase/epimerase [Gaiellaceae bacterium]|nr:sugar phosphate isomerase/epimerase [Gaiellaceae bacterium]
MERSKRLASAPVTWGVWERTSDGDDLIPAGRLLETVAALGYAGIELGPPGYLGADGSEVAAALAAHGLALVGGFAPLHLGDEDGFAADLAAWLDPILDALAAGGARGPAVLADAGGEPRTPLDGAAYERLARAADRCRARGIEPVFHHHVATNVETPAELSDLLEHSDVGICFDTGHALAGGGDPIEVARMCGTRIRHLHLKDVDGQILARLRSGELTTEQAWGLGLFGPFGEGIVDLAAVLALPELAGYDGWIVLEQDRVAVSVGDLEAVREVEARNLAVLAGAETVPATT